MSEQKFAKGIFFERPNEKAPEFVKGKMSIKVDEAVEFLKEVKNEKGYANFDLLKSKDGTKLYFTLNDWKPEVKAEAPSYPQEELNPQDIPF